MAYVSFISCFKRFISRCGAPIKVVSDNLKSFESNETEAYFKKVNITWKPILEKLPWWGGFYERLTAILKSALRKIVQSAKLNFEELYTVLVQLENMINTRPLTYYLSKENCDEHIIQSHLIEGRNIDRRNIVDDNDNIITLDTRLTKTHIKHVTVVTNHFWNRFFKEYLFLSEKHCFHKNNTNGKRELKINDVVLLQDDKLTPRNNWRSGKVEELAVSRDSKIGGAVLHVSNKKKDSTFLLNRPIQKLIQFEIMNCVKEENKNVPNLIANHP